MRGATGAGVVIVGASLAGVRTAASLRRQGFAGPITLVGAEHHWPPVDRPPLSKGVLTGTASVESVRLRIPDLDVRLLLGRVAARLDRTEQAVDIDDGTRVPYDHLVIATGATPRRLGPDRPWLHHLRTAEDASRLAQAIANARTVAVVGAGFIGCEVASACRELRRVTHLVEASSRPLPPLGDSMGAVHEGRIRAAGVNLHLGAMVERLEEVGGRARIGLSNGCEIDADVVVVGIGVQPNTSWLDGSGLALDDGVGCDSACIALGGAGLIHAVGDVARWEHPVYGSIRVEHWTNAGEQAVHVARQLVRGDASPFSPVPYMWSDQFGSKLQLVGRPGVGDEARMEHGDPENGPFVASYRREGRLTAALCVDQPRELPAWTRAVTDACGGSAEPPGVNRR